MVYLKETHFKQKYQTLNYFSDVSTLDLYVNRKDL